jgi:hypothetical protein
MKSATRTIARTIALAALVCIASVSPALHAQTLQARVNVPFSFDCGISHLASGVYNITVQEDGVLILRQGSHAVMVLSHMGYDPSPSASNRVTFTKYGDRYFLTEIATATNLDIEVSESGAEKRATRELASREESASQVAVALFPVGLNRASR